MVDTVCIESCGPDIVEGITNIISVFFVYGAVKIPVYALFAKYLNYQSLVTENIWKVSVKFVLLTLVFDAVSMLIVSIVAANMFISFTELVGTVVISLTFFNILALLMFAGFVYRFSGCNLLKVIFWGLVFSIIAYVLIVYVLGFLPYSRDFLSPYTKNTVIF